MKALVTGHLGFVGRHFHTELLERGYEVLTCDIAEPDFKDCRNPLTQKHWKDIDLVVHCAATIPPIDRRHDNDLLVANDLSIDSSMFQWAMRAKPKKFVYFSSSAAYPAHLQEPNVEMQLVESDIRLKTPATPDRMYGWTKLVGELQAREYHLLGGDILVVRPFSGYGSDQSPDYPFRAMIERAKARVPVFDVWGDGRQVRDFIHIDDIVGGVFAILESYKPGPFNLGTGIPTTMLSLSEQIIAQTPDYHPKVRVMESKPMGTYYRVCNPVYMQQVYAPQITLEQGIERALA